MSLFSWLSPKKSKAPAHSAPSSSGLSRMESTKPYSASRQGSAPAPGVPANRKNERMARRELLYAVVREAMIHAGVLSSSYKFKVLSLDARGRQFLVMVDLAQGAGNDTARLAEIEALIAQAAKSRHDILVSSVYWRSNEHVAVGDPASRVAAHATPSRPAPLEPARVEPVDNFMLPPVAVPESHSQPAELMAAPVPAAATARHGGHHDPLHPDEVAAFKQALAAGVSGSKAFAASQAASPRPAAGKQAKPAQSYTLLTGFEDTEMAEQDAPSGTALSATQYGELR